MGMSRSFSILGLGFARLGFFPHLGLFTNAGVGEGPFHAPTAADAIHNTPSGNSQLTLAQLLTRTVAKLSSDSKKATFVHYFLSEDA
jgi:hypothetical protein